MKLSLFGVFYPAVCPSLVVVIIVVTAAIAIIITGGRIKGEGLESKTVRGREKKGGSKERKPGKKNSSIITTLSLSITLNSFGMKSLQGPAIHPQVSSRSRLGAAARQSARRTVRGLVEVHRLAG